METLSLIIVGCCPSGRSILNKTDKILIEALHFCKTTVKLISSPDDAVDQQKLGLLTSVFSSFTAV